MAARKLYTTPHRSATDRSFQALIVLSMVHLILLTIHCLRPRQDPKPHYLLEISIFVLFICVNVVVIGIGLSGLTHGAFPLALELQNKDIKAKGSSTNISRPYMIFFTSWSGEGTIEYTNGSAASKVILGLREMDKDLTSGQQNPTKEPTDLRIKMTTKSQHMIY
ncbi:predicted protein [Histoplasma capsulatum G186AR]|uniref:Uncharacterized protein n=1 Tax=Ajellomyces capsulatus (strain G186AR / H82 / ATCC MYA-2454 / RMSCC 2432) TaxID=447093 RepID=C0NVS3_AJECG|nr:uncharacterized protein HCBG_07253 [Histoplasma capsulatum G186AR]EEH04612.1 predicted protein [Histoplasma capsulatum G186AR]